MPNGASAFFANFSLRTLVINKLQLPETYPGARGGSGGAGSIGQGLFIVRKSESFLCPVNVSDYISFDEPGFIASIKAEIEKEIIHHESEISRRGNIEGDFNSSEFYFEYVEGEIKGRIVVSGKMVENGYYMVANIEELAKSAGFPDFAQAFRGPASGAVCGVSGSVELPSAPNAFKWAKPEGDYHLVMFSPDDASAHHKFRRTGFVLLHESRNRIPPGVTVETSDDFKYVEVMTLYDALYFLNDAALQMYKEGGIEIETLKKIPIAEIPKRCNRILGGAYFPK